MQSNTLYQITYSPWTEKARFSLDFNKVHFDTKEYHIMLSELPLKIKSNKILNKISVPLIKTFEGEWIQDSYEIAKWANQQNDEHDLFKQDKEVNYWNKKSDQLINWGRVQVINKSNECDELMIELMPDFFPNFLKRNLLFLGRIGSRYITFKHNVIDNQFQVEHLEVQLKEISCAIKSKYILKEFSFADMAIAASLQVIKPVKHSKVVLKDKTYKAYENLELSKKFPELIEWRDYIYQNYR
jgi:glutathione S-transferase